MSTALAKATFATGCFWCAEAAFKLLDGVVSVTSGYAGGTKEHPTYSEVSTGTTGHVEAVQVEYNPAKVSYDDLLKIFWEIHNPTEEDKQGPDVGPQYQAVIFYHTKEQQALAEQSKMIITRARNLKEDEVKTRIRQFETFYPAEEYHKDYYEKHPNEPYSKTVIEPKIAKVKHIAETMEYGTEQPPKI